MNTTNVSYKQLFGFILQFAKKQKWRFGAVLFIDSFCWSLDSLLWPYILHLVVDIFGQFDTDRMAAWEHLKWPMISGLCLVIYVEAASRSMGFMMARSIPRLQADVRMTMFDHVQRHTPRYFNERFAGSLANKISDMTSQIETIFQQFWWPIVPAVSTCLLGSIILWTIAPIFAWILLTWMFIHLSICIAFTRKCDQYEHRHGEARTTLVGKIVDSLTNNYAVNLFYRFMFEYKLLSEYQRDEKKTNVAARQYSEAMRLMLTFFYILAVIVGIYGSMIYMWLHNKISTGQVVQVFTMMWSLAMVLWNVGQSMPILFQAVGMAKQAYSVMYDPQDLGDISQAQPLHVTKGSITFDNVSFNYGEKKLFHNKHVTIQGGEKVGLVGFTGAGKSTFINLILRFYPLDEGKITIDGQNIAEVTLESLRRQIALIPQDPNLFHRSLRDNIAYGNPDATEDQVIQAARLAHCEEFIRNIPGQYEAKVGERGTKLSGGEKQRIAISRAILADAPILILDEATSSLDSLTEKYIQDSLNRLMDNRTTLVIAHRLSTLSHMDRILVFDKGKIVEEGPHDALLKRDGLYAKMWKMQVGGFIPVIAPDAQ